MLNLNLFKKNKHGSGGALLEEPSPNEKNMLHIIHKIKSGDRQLREKLIEDYVPFIKSVVKKVAYNAVIEDSEEYSIGLMAFNEAIDCYSYDKNSKFISFAEIVITRRIKTYNIRKKKDSTVYPFTYFEDEDSGSFEERFLKSDSHMMYQEIEVKEELENFEKNLGKFGITLEYLSFNSPKHSDSKKLCVKIASLIAEQEPLFDSMMSKKSLPQGEILKVFQVHKRTLENNRKYIIAVALLLKSDLEDIKQIFKTLLS